MAAAGFSMPTHAAGPGGHEKKRGRQQTTRAPGAAPTKGAERTAAAEATARTTPASTPTTAHKGKDRDARGGKHQQPTGAQATDDQTESEEPGRAQTRQPTFAKDSIALVLGRDGELGAVETFDWLCRQQHPSTDKTELPCAWRALFG
eukprot:6198283-Pleurochrysis_carterae.AAC.1